MEIVKLTTKDADYILHYLREELEHIDEFINFFPDKRDGLEKIYFQDKECLEKMILLLTKGSEFETRN
jgi:hypothetical protein